MIERNEMSDVLGTRSKLAGAFNRRLMAEQIVCEIWPWLDTPEIEAIAKILVEAFEKR